MEVASISAVNNPQVMLVYIILSEPVRTKCILMNMYVYYNQEVIILKYTSWNSCYDYSQGIHAVVNGGGGECLIILHRKLASSVALILRVSLLVEDNVYLPLTLKFSRIQVTKDVYIIMYC